MQRGRFITFEGGEGAGKSTQVQRLAQELRTRGLEVVTTREPGGSPGAETIRELLVSGETGRWDTVTETLLFLAARRDHLIRVIRPALERGAWVICDRYHDSTVAYQGYGMGLPLEKIRTLYEIAAEGLQPDLTFVLDIPVERGMARAAARSPDPSRYERMDLGFHERLRQGFLTIAKSEPDRCVVVDATMDVDAVTNAVGAAVKSRLLAAIPA